MADPDPKVYAVNANEYRANAVHVNKLRSSFVVSEILLALGR